VCRVCLSDAGSSLKPRLFVRSFVHSYPPFLPPSLFLLSLSVRRHRHTSPLAFGWMGENMNLLQLYTYSPSRLSTCTLYSTFHFHVLYCLLGRCSPKTCPTQGRFIAVRTSTSLPPPLTHMLVKRINQ